MPNLILSSPLDRYHVTWWTRYLRWAIFRLENELQFWSRKVVTISFASSSSAGSDYSTTYSGCLSWNEGPLIPSILHSCHNSSGLDLCSRLHRNRELCWVRGCGVCVVQAFLYTLGRRGSKPYLIISKSLYLFCLTHLSQIDTFGSRQCTTNRRRPA